jgi:DnaJ-class molecular chaperone
MANISQYHGEVRLCDCGIYEHPERQTERACRMCFGRGFVAECKACQGKGKNEVAVNGSDKALGVMASTCTPCGGIGVYGVPKPADWDETHPKEVVAEEAQTAVA